MTSLATLCVVCSLMLLPAAAWASHPLEVEDTQTEGKGNFLFEMTGDYVKDGSVKSMKLTGIITGGLGKHTDLSLETPYLKLNPSPATDSYASGMGDVRFKVKHQLFENEVKQSMAYEVYADLPTGDELKGLGTHNVLWGVMLVDSQECHDSVFHANIGYEVIGRDVKADHFARNYALFAGLAAERKLTESFRVLTEIRAESQKETAGTILYSRPVTLLAGVVYDVTTYWYVDLGGRAGLNHYAEDVAVLAGTALRF